MTMRAAVLHGRRDLRIEDVDVPAPGAGELLLEVAAAGVCGTDAHEYDSGPHLFPLEIRHPVTGHVGPLIPGHEFAGRVVEVGAGAEGFAVGDLVASGAASSCGECDRCRRGRTNLCRVYATVGLHRHGALAEFVAVPASTCLPVGPYGLSADTAALAQPMSIAVHAMRRGGLTAADRALVVGVGGIGAFLTFAASQVTDRLVVADLDAERLALAARLGAGTTVQVGPDGTDPRDDGGEYTVVYEVSGSAAGFRTALECAAPGSRIVLVGLQGTPSGVDWRRFSLTEQELVGTNAHVCGEDLPTALEMLAARRAPWSDVAPDALSLAELVEDGLPSLADGRNRRVKTLIDPRSAATRATDMA